MLRPWGREGKESRASPYSAQYHSIMVNIDTHICTAAARQSRITNIPLLFTRPTLACMKNPSRRNLAETFARTPTWLTGKSLSDILKWGGETLRKTACTANGLIILDRRPNHSTLAPCRLIG
jgi:hypothetical protein